MSSPYLDSYKTITTIALVYDDDDDDGLMSEIVKDSNYPS